MKLQIVSTGSIGNCYILTASNGETLIIECGVKFKAIKEALNHKIDNVVGCLVSHSHMDHSMSLNDFINAGIPVYANRNTFETHNVNPNYNVTKYFDKPSQFQIESDWTIMTFPLIHDVPICGFLIHHPECGKLLFATDTSDILYKFPDLDQIIIEANYSEAILSKMDGYSRNEYLSDRIRNSHLSIEKCIEFLKKTKIQTVQNVVLIHLSDRNSNEKLFQSSCMEQLGKSVVIANNGLSIDLNKNIFDCF